MLQIPPSGRTPWCTERLGLWGLVLLCVGIFFSVVVPSLAASVGWVVCLLRSRDLSTAASADSLWRRGLFLPAIAFLLASGVSAALSQAPGESLLMVGKEAFALGLVFLGVQATTTRQLHVPVAIVLAMSGIIGIWAVYQWRYEYDGMSRVITEGGLEVYRRAHGFWHAYAAVSYGNVQAMLIGLGLGTIVTGPRSWRWPVTLGMLFAMTGVVLSFTRASWLVVVFLIGITALGRGAVRTIIVVGAIVLGVLLCPWDNALTARARTALDVNASVNRDRVVRYEVGLAVAKDYPITGTGPGVLKRVYPSYARPGAEENWHLHNTYLQLLVERGPLALGAWLAMIVAGVVAALRGTRDADPERRGVGVGIALLLVAMLASSLFNYTWEDWRVRGLTLAFLGLAWSSALRGTRGAGRAGDEVPAAMGMTVGHEAEARGRDDGVALTPRGKPDDAVSCGVERAEASTPPSRLLEPVSRIRRKWDEAISDAEMHHRGFGDFARRLRDAGVDRVEGVRLLDIGCGDRAPLALLFAAAGARVSAIDLVPVTFGWGRPVMWGRTVRGAGAAEGGRQVVRDLVHTFRYWRRLSRLSSAPLPFDCVTVRQMNAERLDFPDESFDVVVSSAVWEHLTDVGRATREVNRVLAPGGVALIQIALFPSLQGGHHAEWHSVEPGRLRRIRPWDHLRSGAQPLPLYCNGWREAQYREVFEREMRLVRWENGPLDGAAFLTPEIRAELSAYSERDLLLLAVTAWARKRQG